MNVKTDFTAGLIIGIMVFMAINSMPFTDSTQYRKAISECEKSLPRDQHCKVIGVKDDQAL